MHACNSEIKQINVSSITNIYIFGSLRSLLTLLYFGSITVREGENKYQINMKQMLLLQDLLRFYCLKKKLIKDLLRLVSNNYGL